MASLEFRSPPKRAVLSDIQNQNGNSPISPMANLKLLTKVATGQISICDNNEDKLKKCRRLRSLSFICKKFLLSYKLDLKVGEHQQISLGNLAMLLEIEKRRVYDIINVVASLQMAVKVCKDKYNWYGYQNLPQVLSQLKGYALLNKFDEQYYVYLQKYINATGEMKINRTVYSLERIKSFVQNYPHLSLSAYIEKEPVVGGTLQIVKGNQKVFEENRIGILCQKFIMLFLVVDENWPLNLTVISKLILMKDIQDKTGMRRLYDVANVLEALGLVKKCDNKEYKKPSFVYCGPKVEPPPSIAQVGDVFINDLSCHSSDACSDITDTNSESSLDAITNGSKLDSMLEVICTELNHYKRKDHVESEPPAKKRLLFPPPSAQLPPDSFHEETTQLTRETIMSESTPNVSFIKAPASSFRFSSNCISVQGEHNITHFRPTVTKEELSRIKSCKVEPNKTVILTRLTRPLRVIKPAKLSDIQNGGIYKAIVGGNGNTIKFVKL